MKYEFINLAIWGNWGSWSCPGDCTTQTLYRYRACVKPNGGCGSAPAQNIACKRLGCACKLSYFTPSYFGRILSDIFISRLKKETKVCLTGKI